MFTRNNLVAACITTTILFSLPTSAKTLIYCSEGSPEGFNPQLYTAGTTFDASSRQIYNRLVEFELGTSKVIPGLAESWSVSDNGKVYTFKLRKGVKWHNTLAFKASREFNADDVVFSFERQLKKDHPYHNVSGGSYEYFNGMDMPNFLIGVEKLDDHTVRLSLNEPEAPFIANLAMDFASIQSAEYAGVMMAAGTPEKVDLDPVGTGPFQLVGYQKDAVIRYKANPNYFRGKAAIDNLVFAITLDASVRYAKLKAGECHVMPYPNPADVKAMQSDTGETAFRYSHDDGIGVFYWIDGDVGYALAGRMEKDELLDVANLIYRQLNP